VARLRKAHPWERVPMPPADIPDRYARGPQGLLEPSTEAWMVDCMIEYHI
jgi:hypothetical protein